MGRSSGSLPGRSRHRIAGSIAFLCLSLALVSVPAWADAGRDRPGPAPHPADLRVFARPPVLVRTGERVQIPVDVACAAPRGTACATSVGLRARVPGRPWSASEAPSGPRLSFDLTALGERSIPVAQRSGRVDYRIRAVTQDGTSATLPAKGEGAAASYYVAPEIPTIPVPVIDFGDVREGRVALFLPWGSGPGAAGLAPGVEASTVGPSSFDVDANGRLLLVDQLQGRVARFDAGVPAAEWRLDLGPRPDVAIAADGAAYVSSAPAGEGQLPTVSRLDANGGPTVTVPVGVVDDMPAELRTAGDAAYLRVLPLDAWLPVSGATGTSFTGMPLDDGSELLKVTDEHTVRLATVTDGEVTDPVELLFEQNVAEIALAEPDGGGGYLAVVHVWQEVPAAADQYDVIHVSADHQVRTFAVAREDYAEAAPLSTFRLGGDGFLYQLTSAPDGLRIVRFDLGGIR